MWIRSNSNESLLISLKEHIESSQNEIYFLREEIRQKDNFISTIFQKNQHGLHNCSEHEEQLPESYQKTIAKQEANTAELENKVTEINNVTANLTKVADIAVPTNVSNLSSKNNSPSTIENIQHTHEPLPSIPSNTAENEEEVGSRTAKEQQENSQTENNRQAPQNKRAFIVRDSMLKDVDGYLLTGSLNKKFIEKVRPFSSAKIEYMHDYLKPSKRDFDPNICILYRNDCG